MSEPDLIFYYGLSAGAGLLLARIVGAFSEYLHQQSKLSSFAWLDSALSEHQFQSIREDELLNGPGYGRAD
ncbi:MAG: hypothetical protein ACT4PQ_14730 [Betaproteobacteria bacterium]